MSTIKRRRGFKGKVVLRSLRIFKPEEVQGAYEKDGELFLELQDGDALIVDYVHLCENEEAAWELYSNFIEERTGIKLERKAFWKK